MDSSGVEAEPTLGNEREETVNEPGSWRKASWKKNQLNKNARELQELLEVLEGQVKPFYHELCGSESNVRIDWDSLPPLCDPLRNGRIADATRAQRKRWQCESVYHILAPLTVALRQSRQTNNRPLNIVDFASSTGQFSLPLAACLPDCMFTLVDFKPKPLELAEQHAREAGLTNVHTYCGCLENYDSDFDIGIAMHACGSLSDMAQTLCIMRSAAFVITPCCIGQVKHVMGGTETITKRKRREVGNYQMMRYQWDVLPELYQGIQYPRSKRFRDVMTVEEYMLLAKNSDFSFDGTHGNFKGTEEMDAGTMIALFQRAKALLELDRCLWATENDYQCLVCKLVPQRCSVKRDVLVGLPSDVDMAPVLAQGAPQKDM